MNKKRHAEGTATRSTPSRGRRAAPWRAGFPALAAAGLLLAGLAPGGVRPAGAQDADAPEAPRLPSPGSLAEPPPPPQILDEERAAAHARADADAGAGASAAAARSGGSGGATAAGSETATPADTRPFGAHLAPAQKGRADDLEEVIVVGRKNPYNLPDLGSAKAATEAAEGSGRIRVTLLPLYDPVMDGPGIDDPFGNREIQRVGYIHVFELRFGGRHKD